MMKLSAPQMASMLMQIGDVIPFRQRSVEPGMGATEGARIYTGGANPGSYEAALLEQQRMPGLIDAVKAANKAHLDWYNQLKPWQKSTDPNIDPLTGKPWGVNK